MENAGADVTMMQSGSLALTRLAKENFGLAVLNDELDGISAGQAARFLRLSPAKNIALILLRAGPANGGEKDVFNLVLEKPFTAEDLLYSCLQAEKQQGVPN